MFWIHCAENCTSVKLFSYEYYNYNICKKMKKKYNEKENVMISKEWNWTEKEEEKPFKRTYLLSNKCAKLSNNCANFHGSQGSHGS